MTKQAISWSEYYAARAAQVQDKALQHFFAQGCLSADTPIQEAPLVALDMETTGLDSRRHAIVSIGVQPFTLNRIRLHERRYWVLRPPRPLSEKSITFHRITHSEIAEAPDFNDILDELLEQLTGRIPVVHFANIERPFLDSAIKDRRGEGLRCPMVDTMAIEARFERRGWRTLWTRLLGRQPASIRLHDSRHRYGLPVYQAHHALTDALATAELFQAQVATHFSPDTPISEFWR